MEKTLELEELDVNLFRSKQLWKPIGNRGVFGGQVIGLALRAAMYSINPKYKSLHAYFVMPGDNTIPILYRVDELRTGNTYATRSIKAMQRGKTIFICTASFAIPEASELEFQIKMPIVPPPDNYQSDEDIIRSLLEMPQYSEYHSTINLRLQQPFPVITKRVSRKDMPLNSETKQYIWVKSKENLGDDICLHQCIAAFLSDHELLSTALIPHHLHRINKNRLKHVKMMTSLDHAMWFHKPFRADEWMLYELETTQSGAGRGFANARLWSQDGRLVASTAQEGVIRATLAKPKL